MKIKVSVRTHNRPEPVFISNLCTIDLSSLCHSSHKLAGNCLLICHPTADRDDGAGIVSCGKRLSISLVFHWQGGSRQQQQQQQRMPSIYMCACSWDGDWWSMRVHSDDWSFHASSIVTTWVCTCAHVFVSVLPLCFLSAAYQLTMATNRALLTAAG